MGVNLAAEISHEDSNFIKILELAFKTVFILFLEKFFIKKIFIKEEFICHFL